ncbi:methyltransferase domain-containing protein [Luteimonas sp. 22616]|uniref:methyltransferase domain-containing protein n=1 Tax=Luteimonas sp. 22616 TaxID=3453951 RepID=UPI003F848E78
MHNDTPSHVVSQAPGMSPRHMQTLDYSALEKLAVLPPVDRVEYVVGKVRGMRVMDLGALDETAYKAKSNTRNWLHKEMAAVAAQVVGIDNSSLVPAEGLNLSENSRIFLGDIYELGAVLEAHGNPDVIVAGELIEHLPDTLAFLRNLKRDCSAGDPLVVITTPNACSMHNAILGVFRRESMHKDHLQIYSYKTLHTIFERAGFREWTIRPYRARFTEMIQESTGIKRFVVVLFEKFVNFMERRFPLLGCGWVCEIRL